MRFSPFSGETFADAANDNVLALLPYYILRGLKQIDLIPVPIELFQEVGDTRITRPALKPKTRANMLRQRVVQGLQKVLGLGHRAKHTAGPVAKLKLPLLYALRRRQLPMRRRGVLHASTRTDLNLVVRRDLNDVAGMNRTG